MESPAPNSQCFADSSKRKDFPGGSSSWSGFEEGEILETVTSNQINSKPVPSKNKEVCEIIDLDSDDDMLINGETDRKGKAKEISSDFSMAVDNLPDFVDLDYDLNFNIFTGRDKLLDNAMMFDDYTVMDDSQFDHMPPPDVEVPFPCLQVVPTPPNTTTTTTTTSSSLEIQEPVPNLSSSHYPLKKMRFNEHSDSSNVEKHSGGGLAEYLSSVNNANYSKPWNESLLTPVHYTMNNYATNVDTSPSYNIQTGLTGSSSSLNKGSGAFPPWKNFPVSFGGNYATIVDTSPSYPSYNIQTGLTGSSSLNKGSGASKNFPVNFGEIHAMMPVSGFWSGPRDCLNLEPPPGPTVVEKNMDEIMNSFDRFNKFDTVEDCSDHYYAAHYSLNQATRPKNWAKRIQEEWKILENSLPDAIFVRVYESRMDLLRAVIVGAEGTPYHDGLFFFDIYFPASYPDYPPQVFYHSGGLRINPNLYNSGKVCLSLLNTWSGEKREEWIPGVSTMLQVLVSIQGLILNAEPYFNEPGFAGLVATEWVQKSSLLYNETVFILSMQTMVYSMNRPPKHFEAFVTGHFCKHAHDILVSCKAYLEGAQVGCLVRGGIQDVELGDKSCSADFKYRLAGFITTLIDALTRIGAKDCNKFRPLAEKVPTIAPPPPPSYNLVPVMSYFSPSPFS